MKNYLWLLLVMCIAALSSCHNGYRQAVIIIQPYNGFSGALTDTLYREIKDVIPTALLRPPVALPTAAFNTIRGRYRADSLLHFLGDDVKGDTVIMGLTNKDVSTGKGAIADWGVIGLGRCPGNVCLVSTFRLSVASRQSQLYKVALHELGHTQGLPHCPTPTCFMRDAAGSNPTNEETGFCPKCKSYLQNRGWLLK